MAIEPTDNTPVQPTPSSPPNGQGTESPAAPGISRRTKLITLGVVLVVIVAAVWLAAAHHSNKSTPKATPHTTKQSTVATSTDCYTIKTIAGMHATPDDDCSLTLYTSKSLSTSALDYTVDPLSHPEVTADNFTQYMQDNQAAIVSSLSKSDTTYTLLSSRSGTFAGSPAYYLELKSSHDFYEEDVYVYHQETGDLSDVNIFQMTAVSASQPKTVAPLEAAFSWK